MSWVYIQAQHALEEFILSFRTADIDESRIRQFVLENIKNSPTRLRGKRRNCLVDNDEARPVQQESRKGQFLLFGIS